ncbi:MAG: DNA repair protein RecO [Dysgonamonadaceae bacterium]|nr:DNA repair protein RecO [Dysgonamonadaceae bacterium]
MHHKTQGIVLGTRKYNDRFSITQVFSSEFGRTAYMLPQSKSKKSKINQALFFPLSVVNLEVEHFPFRQIHRIKEAQRQFPLYSINVNLLKVSIAFFLSEFLTQVLQETHENTVIFNFLKESIVTLEKKETGIANFHIVFMFSLTQFLGISPNLDNYKDDYFFDLLNGEYVANRPINNHFLNIQESRFLNLFKRINFNNMHLLKLSQYNRNEIINYILDYYRIHVYDFPEIKSLQVLRELY